MEFVVDRPSSLDSWEAKGRVFKLVATESLFGVLIGARVVDAGRLSSKGTCEWTDMLRLR